MQSIANTRVRLEYGTVHACFTHALVSQLSSVRTNLYYRYYSLVVCPNATRKSQKNKIILFSVCERYMYVTPETPVPTRMPTRHTSEGQTREGGWGRTERWGYLISRDARPEIAPSARDQSEINHTFWLVI